MKEIGSQAVQDIADRIDHAYTLFYRNRKNKLKASPPNFKKVKKYKSFTLKQAGWKLNEDLGIIRIGNQNYKYFQSRKIEGKIKTVTIKRDSNGKDIENPLFFAKNSKIIKTANQRKDFHFKTTRKICEEYSVVCLEDLNLKGMKKLYGRKVSDLGFYSFIQKLQYEASKFGTSIIFIDRWYASSQICSECGYKNPEIKNLKIRKWKCSECGAKHDRDRNAAINILRVGASRPL